MIIRTLSVVLIALALLAGCAHSKDAADAPPLEEVRGVWITNVDSDVLTSREKIAEAMEFLAAHNFNVVFPVVWNKAYTLYPSEVMEEFGGVAIDPLYGDRDPLAELIVEAHRVGLEVVPWFEYGFAASYQANGGRMLEIRPDWASLDKDGNLATKNGFEWMNALDPEVQDFLASLILEVARKYDVDGIQGDDRLPALPSLGGYNPEIVAQYLSKTGKQAPEDEKEPHWVQWRADILTEFLEKLREDVKEVSPDLLVSMSPSYYDWSLYEYLQDSKTWTDRELIDAIHPQAYRYELEAYEKVIDDIVQNQFTAEQLPLLSPGVLIKSGSYRIPADMLLACIAMNRARGVNGEVHFFYEGLRENDNELAKALKRGPYRQRAILPWRANRPWRPGAIEVGAGEPRGAWRQDGTFLRSDESRENEVVYTLKVPATGTYDVYMKLPSGGAEAVVRLEGEGNRLAAAHLKTKADTAERWHHAGMMEIRAGSEDFKLVVSNAVAEEPARVVAGPVMLLLNRRNSPETNWP